ncbi:M23 family metallopeptidase [Microbacterium maritypicum]|nr:M23 family metallopeptidase [Microbacterium liquefaciens]
MLAATGITAGVALVGRGILTGESASAAVPATNGYIYPTDPFKASTEAAGQFNAPREGTRRHMGLDTWGYRGMPVLAIAGGYVSGGDWESTPSDPHGWGNHIVVDHGNSVVSRYAHFEGAPIVARGATVAQGQTLGYMGNSQRGPRNSAMGVHLHFEILVNGAFVSPLAFLAGNSSPPVTNPNPDPGYEPIGIADMTFLCITPINGTNADAGVYRWIIDPAAGTKRNIDGGEYEYLKTVGYREVVGLQAPITSARYQQIYPAATTP